MKLFPANQSTLSPSAVTTNRLKDQTPQALCTLEHASLLNRPEYEALSYVWGDLNVLTTISLDGGDFEVTTNLAGALLHLQPDADKPRALWVDALCINQSDVPEKNEQVQFMGEVYKNARVVIVWLGLAGDRSDAVMDDVQVYGAAALAAGITDVEQSTWPQLQVFGSSEPAEPLVQVKLNAVLEGCFPPSSHDTIQQKLYNALRLSLRPWFNHVWIMQEVSLARDAMVLCGTKAVSWNEFESYYHLCHLLWKEFTLQRRVREPELEQGLLDFEDRCRHVMGYRLNFKLALSARRNLRDSIAVAAI